MILIQNKYNKNMFCNMRILKMSKILLIDDNAKIIDVYKDILTSHIRNCEIYTALTGEEGLDIVYAILPDTILLDVVMPGIDGYEVCRRIRENETTKCIPVIMITGGDFDAGSRLKSIDVGADLFLNKPVKSGELITQVKSMLRIKDAEDILKLPTKVTREKNLNELRNITYKMIRNIN